MTTESWPMLEAIKKDMKTPDDLPPGMMMAVAERLDEAITSPSRHLLVDLAQHLEDLFRHMLRLAPPATTAALTPGSGTSECAAYALGQVGFAQHLAALATERRVEDHFPQLLQDSRYKIYIAALAQNDMPGKELAQLSREREETVSRKLKYLREQGVTDFRREGTRFFNFLTPAARTFVATMPEWQNDPVSTNLDRTDKQITTSSRDIDLTDLNKITNPLLQKQQFFSPELRPAKS